MLKPVKDNFSVKPENYLQFRPVYPEDLYQWIIKAVPGKSAAWDCGTGNGQVAIRLASDFAQVYGSDISPQQLSKAIAAPNVEYIGCRAEQTPFPDNSFDLITVAQAIHWFDFEAFYGEVQRTGKAGSILAGWGYGLLRIEPDVDAVIQHFYRQVIGPWWDAERKYIDEAYRTIPFPFESLPVPDGLHITTHWKLPALEGYLYTWSSVKKYIAEQKTDPVSELVTELAKLWRDNETKEVRFPLFMRMGRIRK